MVLFTFHNRKIKLLTIVYGSHEEKCCIRIFETYIEKNSLILAHLQNKQCFVHNQLISYENKILINDFSITSLY